ACQRRGFSYQATAVALCLSISYPLILAFLTQFLESHSRGYCHYRRATLFAHGRTPPHFVEEFLQEGHLAVRPRLSHGLSRRERDEAFAIRTDIEIRNGAGLRKPLPGPPRLAGLKRIALRRVAYHHDLPVLSGGRTVLDC